MNLDEILRYDRPVENDYNKLHIEHKKTLEWIGSKKEVLEIGCHTGYLSYWIRKQHNTVTGIELNKKAIEKATANLDEAIHGNIEDETLWQKLSGRTFDVITYMHVLEHLLDPWEVLKRTNRLLKDDGILIIGLPNVCNADTRFNMFFGNFKYTDIGIMDKTHLRFFNQQTAKELIQDSEFEIIKYFSPWQLNPTKEFIDHLPFFYRFKKLFSNNPPKFPKYSSNLTDAVMLFKCKKKKNM